LFISNSLFIYLFIGEFDRFIGKIGRYLLVGDFTVHNFNQMNFGRFLLNFIEFDQFFQKQMKYFFNVRCFLNTAYGTGRVLALARDLALA
jgi:hypothetical protein